MKILLASEVPRQREGGTAGVLFSLAEALSELGHEVDLLFGSDCGRLLQWDNRICQTFFGLSLFRHVLLQRLKGRQYDVIDISGANAYMAGVMRLLGCARAVLGRTHGGPQEPGEERQNFSLKHRISLFVYGLQCKIGDKSIDLFIVPTLSHMSNLPPSLAGIARAAPYGLDEAFLASPIRREASDKSRIMYAGTWIERKGLRYLVDAIVSLARIRSDFRLSVVGVDDCEQVAASFAGSAHLVSVLPQLGQGELLKIYDDNDIFVFPSLSEGYGRVIVEAMSRELCVITTNVGIVPDLIKDGVNGFIISKSDSGSIISKVTWLLDRPEIARQVAKAGRATAEHLTWQDTARKMLDIYSEALAPSVR